MFFGSEQNNENKPRVDLYVDGRPATQDEVAKICKVYEGYSYMADYILDENGVLKEIHYDKVCY